MRLLAPVVVVALLAASCGSDAEPAAVDEAPVDEAPVDEVVDEASDAVDDVAYVAASGDVVEDAQESAEDQADALEEVQEQQGGGSARLVVGDDEWTFDSVLCSFGEGQIGQEGAEFVLSSIRIGSRCARRSTRSATRSASTTSRTSRTRPSP